MASLKQIYVMLNSETFAAFFGPRQMRTYSSGSLDIEY